MTTSISSSDAGRKFITKVYGWMVVAMLISAAAAIITANLMSTSESFIRIMASGGFIGLIVAELVLVFLLSLAIRKMPVMLAGFFFVLYSVIDGMTLSSIFFVYEIGTISMAFIACAVMFLAMTVYGAFTKSDLNSARRYLFMALVGIIIASVINIFFLSTMLDRIITLVSIVVFVGLTAYDTQKIIKASQYYDNSEAFNKAAIISALELYLDFINLFLSLLRFFGKKRD